MKSSMKSMFKKLAGVGSLVAAFGLGAVSAQADLVAWYPLDEGAGGTADDASAYGNTLLAGGAGWLGTGAFGGSYQVSPGDVLIARTGLGGSLTDLQAVTGNKASIAFWAKPNNENQGAAAFWISDSNGGPGNRISQTHLEWVDGTTYFDVDWTQGFARVAGNLGVVSDALHHYVMTYNGDTGLMRIYKDGGLAVSGFSVAYGSLNWAAIQNFEIGALSFDSWWPGGQIDDFAIWNEDLSEATITQIYREGVASTVIPEPATAMLALLAGFGALARRSR